MLSIQAFLMLFTDILTKKRLFLIRFSMISHTSALYSSCISHTFLMMIA
ncbi:hypothetical protein BACOVA_03331 [Bacteroides ovatus ATCC 8483]|uniref:Uncharacterized protein n=1 Tax=Bacteroides ovatus (strain ATCC 8483 / DSM 1896 / JCM 5824 / BCRC 10623 / CCUG 4943 / NCTC 11153) TaxID=411476 RepID=A0AAN3D6H5_BACO1|nr:hypothetical protein BACOVA_03331 [Bacteroides ovatus ATCC 8483]